jgi:hypothetical protein
MDTPPPLPRTTRTIKRIAPLRAGIMLAIVYGILGLVVIPFFLLMTAFASQMPQNQRVGVLALGTGFAIFVPIFYAVIGFIGGVLGAFVYNLAAKWVGGFEVDVE